MAGIAIPKTAQDLLSAAWRGTDPMGRSYVEALDAARKRAATGVWDVPAQVRASAYADLRTLATSTTITLSGLTPDARPNDVYSDRWGTALVYTMKRLAKKTGYKGESIQEEEKGASPVAMAALEIIAIVLGALIVVGLIGWIVWKVAEVVDNELAREASERELVRVHSEAEKVVSDHLAREAKEGKEIPWSPAELDVLTRTEKFISTLEHGMLPAPPTPPGDGPGIGTGLLIGAGAVVAAVLYGLKKGWI